MPLPGRGNTGRWNPSIDHTNISRGERGGSVLGRGFRGGNRNGGGPPFRGGGPRGTGVGRESSPRMGFDGRGGFGSAGGEGMHVSHAARGGLGVGIHRGGVMGGRIGVMGGHGPTPDGILRGTRGGGRGGERDGRGRFLGGAGGRGMGRGRGGRYQPYPIVNHNAPPVSWEEEFNHGNNLPGAYERMAEENEYESGHGQELDLHDDQQQEEHQQYHEEEEELEQGEERIEYSRLEPPPPPPLPPPSPSDASNLMSYEASTTMHHHHHHRRQQHTQQAHPMPQHHLSQPPLPPPNEQPPVPPSYPSSGYINEEASIHSSAGGSIHHHHRHHHHENIYAQGENNHYIPSMVSPHEKRFPNNMGRGSGRSFLGRGIPSGRGAMMSGRGRGGDMFMGIGGGRGGPFSSMIHQHGHDFRKEDVWNPLDGRNSDVGLADASSLPNQDGSSYTLQHNKNIHHSNMMDPETMGEMMGGREILGREVGPRGGGGAFGRGRMNRRGGGREMTTQGGGRFVDPFGRGVGRDGGRMGGRGSRGSGRGFRGGRLDEGNMDHYHGRGYGVDRRVYPNINAHRGESDGVGAGGYASLANHDEDDSYHQQGQDVNIQDETKTPPRQSMDSSPVKSASKLNLMDLQRDEYVPSAPPSPIPQEEAHIVPPSPPAGAPSNLAVEMARMYDLTSQMEFQYAKHLQNIREHEMIKAKIELLKDLPIGIDAFRDMLQEDEQMD